MRLTTEERALLGKPCKSCRGKNHYVLKVTATSGNLDGKIAVGDTLVEHRAPGKASKREIFFLDSKNKICAGEYHVKHVDTVPIERRPKGASA